MSFLDMWETRTVSKYPALPLFIDALAADTEHLTDAELGLYLRILMTMWRSPRCRIPNDDAWIARHFRSPIAQVRAIIKEFCDSDGNFVRQKRLFREWNYIGAKRQAQSVRAKSKWRNKKVDPQTHAREHDLAYAPIPTPTPIKERGVRVNGTSGKNIIDALNDVWDRKIERAKAAERTADVELSKGRLPRSDKF